MSKSFDKSRMYQGWSTVQTWCIALTFDNSHPMLTQALEIVSCTDFPKENEVRLRGMASHRIHDIKATAPWAWDEGQSFDEDVNWNELREHYERKRKEGL